MVQLPENLLQFNFLQYWDIHLGTRQGSMIDLFAKILTLHKKWSFPLKTSSVRPNPQKIADLVTFTEETLHGKLHFLCCVNCFWQLTISSKSYIFDLNFHRILKLSQDKNLRVVSTIFLLVYFLSLKEHLQN